VPEVVGAGGCGAGGCGAGGCGAGGCGSAGVGESATLKAPEVRNSLVWPHGRPLITVDCHRPTSGAEVVTGHVVVRGYKAQDAQPWRREVD
jgi:hypothetical protein